MSVALVAWHRQYPEPALDRSRPGQYRHHHRVLKRPIDRLALQWHTGPHCPGGAARQPYAGLVRTWHDGGVPSAISQPPEQVYPAMQSLPAFPRLSANAIVSATCILALLHFGQNFLQPLALALILSLVIAPLIRMLSRTGLSHLLKPP
ncbi:hypothetical protein LP419_34860 [Massilia sp. H-1]|nr:hypothetical protein LP419_34860 [Massilia sp. H-1]